MAIECVHASIQMLCSHRLYGFDFAQSISTLATVAVALAAVMAVSNDTYSTSVRQHLQAGDLHQVIAAKLSKSEVSTAAFTEHLALRQNQVAPFSLSLSFPTNFDARCISLAFAFELCAPDNLLGLLRCRCIGRGTGLLLHFLVYDVPLFHGQSCRYLQGALLIVCAHVKSMVHHIHL